MARSNSLVFLEIVLIFCFSVSNCEAKAVTREIRSDVIVTKYGPDPDLTEDAQKQPGWMRRQLVRFGNIASTVSDKLGGTAGKVASIIEKICKMMKAVIPIVAAVCTVGQFEFCTSADAPAGLVEAMSKPNAMVDLSEVD